MKRQIFKDDEEVPISKKQLVRLIRLVAQLKENRYPNCAGFAEDMRKADLNENLNVACTARTIFRDIQTLKNDFDAPIQFSHRRNGYFLTDHKWNFSCPQVFDDSGMLSAVLGARLAEHIFPAPMKRQIRNAVDFLLTCNNPNFLEKGQIESLVVIPPNRTEINVAVFSPLFYAWQNHEVCHISYVDSKGKASDRDFEPHALIFFDGVWYAKGYCRTREEMRTLVVPRMKSVVPTGKSFKPNKKIIQTATEEGIFDPEMVSNVVVECDEYLANIIHTRPLHPEQKVERIAGGGCRISVAEMSKYRLITWIMHQCGRATILRPEGCRSEVADFSQRILIKHKQCNCEE